MIKQPSQFECDKMEKGDVVYVQKVGTLYNWYRKLFKKNAPKIKVRRNWEEPIVYDEYYQEDCILIYAYEVACEKIYNKEVICEYTHHSKLFNRKEVIALPKLQIGLYNMTVTLPNLDSLTIPISVVSNAINTNSRTLKAFDDNRKVQEAIKFEKYKGSYFKKYVEDNNIDSWVFLHCAYCGKPSRFIFKDDCVMVENDCDCDNLHINFNKLSYDEFALWYASNVNLPKVIKKYNEFWFKK